MAELIKRMTIGGYVKADTTGTGNWEVGKITRFDNQSVWFESATDDTVVKIVRSEAYKATEREYKDALPKAQADQGELVMDDGVLADIEDAEAELSMARDEDLPKVMDDATLDRLVSEAGVARKAIRPGQAVDLEADADDAEKESRSIVDRGAVSHYVKSKSAKGNVTLHVGDATALALEGKTLDECYAIGAATLGEDEAEMRTRWQHLNVGQQRMLIGNRMRALAKRREKEAAEKLAKEIEAEVNGKPDDNGHAA